MLFRSDAARGSAPELRGCELPPDHRLREIVACGARRGALQHHAALAQHHGVPTRSLDWTRNPFYAAYFAGSEVESQSVDGRIAVWAVRPDLLLEQGRAERYNSEYTRFLHHTVPNSENPYLRSQEGLFIHPTYGCAHIARTGEFPNLEAFAKQVQSESSSAVIRMLALPYSEVGELLRLLWLKGVSRAHLMPTIDNVTHALSSRWKWAS